MISVVYIVKTLLTALIYIFILRLWMYYNRVNFHNPFTQFIVNLTQPILNPLSKVVPTFTRVDGATVVIIYLSALLKVIFTFTYTLKSPFWQTAYLLYAIYTVLSSFGHLVFWLLLARAVLSWITNNQTPADDILSQLTDPLVQPIRRFIPPLGYIDLSFMVLAFILVALNLFAYDIVGPLWGIL